MAAELIRRLAERLDAAAVVSGAALHERSAGVWGMPSGLQGRVLVRPADTAGVAATLALCHELRQPVVVHGGLTGVVRGTQATADDLILSLERLTAIEAIDPVGRTLTAQAGVTLQAAQNAAAEHGLMFPLDLGARGTATLGGNAATNAGGNRVLRYGMARDLILGLEAVLADGTVLSSLNRMIKNNAGYDLKQLFIGTEGTLGVVTRLVVRLVQQPVSQDTGFAAVAGFDQLAAFLGFMDSALSGRLSAFEVLWRDFYRFLIEPPPSGAVPLDAGHPYYVLVESLGGDPQRDGARFEEAMGEALRRGLLVDAVVAQSQRERDAMWAIRDDVERLLSLQPIFLFDVSLPIGDMERYVEQVDSDLREQWPDRQIYVFGHLGDGNLHLAVCAGPKDGAARRAVETIIYEPLQQLGGSVSAEHGIGLEKKPWLSLCRSDAEISLMRALKRTLDPRGILNPGKVFGVPE